MPHTKHADPHPSVTPAPAADWTNDTRFYEYTKAADPRMTNIPIEAFPSSLHEHGPTRITPCDLSQRILCEGPATTPSLLASFVRIRQGDSIMTTAVATSQLFYVIRGAGDTRCEHGTIQWEAGDLFVLPATKNVIHHATHDSAMYWVSDEPLLRYLGVEPALPRFNATHFKNDRIQQELEKVANEPGAEKRNRRGILLGNAATPQTLTLTHVMWSLMNVLPKKSFQKPHRHNSVALDLCVSAAPGTYTLIGKELNADGTVKNPVRADWLPGAAFVTPPGWWHSHHNDSDQDAVVLPVQEAGLYTFLRTLDIQFA